MNTAGTLYFDFIFQRYVDSRRFADAYRAVMEKIHEAASSKVEAVLYDNFTDALSSLDHNLDRANPTYAANDDVCQCIWTYHSYMHDYELSHYLQLL
jgi:hypothetical protein